MTKQSQAERRELRFETLEELLAEVDRLVEADRAGRLRAVGNWTAGQILGHIAAWIEYGYDGYPMAKPPWFVRFMARRFFKRMLRRGMQPGFSIPGVEGGTYGIDDMPTEEAAERLKRAIARLQAGEPAKFHSPAFGTISEEDRIQLTLRHAELHLGFLVPDATGEQ
ncbi:MAG: DUF1569 domain-containing protein [Planctomycetes bacterium]|nr:DUF1569 domain-containing protein [Planctomycetota bacterium]